MSAIGARWTLLLAGAIPAGVGLVALPLAKARLRGASHAAAAAATPD